jgi:hypothetical protein
LYTPSAGTDPCFGPAECSPTTECGAVYKCQPPERAVVKEAGEWNHLTIVVHGRHVQVEMNGMKIVDANVLSVAEWRNVREQGK